MSDINIFDPDFVGDMLKFQLNNNDQERIKIIASKYQKLDQIDPSILAETLKFLVKPRRRGKPEGTTDFKKLRVNLCYSLACKVKTDMNKREGIRRPSSYSAVWDQYVTRQRTSMPKYPVEKCAGMLLMLVDGGGDKAMRIFELEPEKIKEVYLKL